MKLTKTVGTAAVLMATTTLASFALTADDAVKMLEDAGYTKIEVEEKSNGEVEIEGSKADGSREITLDADGNIIEDVTEFEDEDGNGIDDDFEETEEEDDEDENDEDESDEDEDDESDDVDDKDEKSDG